MGSNISGEIDSVYACGCDANSFPSPSYEDYGFYDLTMTLRHNLKCAECNKYFCTFGKCHDCDSIKFCSKCCNCKVRRAREMEQRETAQRMRDAEERRVRLQKERDEAEKKAREAREKEERRLRDEAEREREEEERRVRLQKERDEAEKKAKEAREEEERRLRDEAKREREKEERKVRLQKERDETEKKAKEAREEEERRLRDEAERETGKEEGRVRKQAERDEAEKIVTLERKSIMEDDKKEDKNDESMKQTCEDITVFKEIRSAFDMEKDINDAIQIQLSKNQSPF